MKRFTLNSIYLFYLKKFMSLLFPYSREKSFSTFFFFYLNGNICQCAVQISSLYSFFSQKIRSLIFNYCNFNLRIWFHTCFPGGKLWLNFSICGCDWYRKFWTDVLKYCSWNWSLKFRWKIQRVWEKLKCLYSQNKEISYFLKEKIRKKL